MKKILLFILSIISTTALFSCDNSGIVKAPKPDVIEKENLGDYGNVELAFPILSDIHFSSIDNDAVMEYYPKALAYSMEETKNRLDAVIVAGDFSEGYEKDYDTLIALTRREVGPEIPLIASYGNHEGDGKHNFFIKKFNKQIDYVENVNGYNIIVLGAHAGNKYTKDQAKALDTYLNLYTSEDPSKPVFVIVHHPVYDTHTNDFGNNEFRSVLDKYPQAFVICGHEHQFFSKASLWQGTFTSFRNAYLKNSEKGQYALLRITDKNVIVIKKYEISPGDEKPHCIGDDIVIDFNEYLNSK